MPKSRPGQGPIAENGDVELVIGFDHRVMDGALIVRVFGEIAAKLNEAIVRELNRPLENHK